jgi:hypothetical protein
VRELPSWEWGYPQNVCSSKDPSWQREYPLIKRNEQDERVKKIISIFFTFKEVGIDRKAVLFCDELENKEKMRNISKNRKEKRMQAR